MAARRVYLSSTFVDLKDFREKVLERLRRAQSVVVAMEDYAAFDARPADKCLADVASCDIYIGVLGRRYGYVPLDDNPEQLSITEMEYRRAGNPGPGKPPLKRLMFQLDPGAGWPDEYCDAKTGDNEAGARIDRFRADVSARHGIRTFRAPEELAGLVLESLLAMLQPESAWRWPPIWDFGAYMAHKGKDFVGRDWLFRDIDDWLAKPAPRALLIRADFGVGKSAILSELIKRNPGGAIVGWHFCQHDTQDTLAPATFVRNLASQLAAALPAYRTLVEAEPALHDKLDRAGDDPASAFEAAIVGPLGRIAPPGGARLLIVDALDEALELDAPTAQRHGNLIRLLANKAGRLPDWVRLLVTSRNNPEVIRPLRTFGLKEIDAENVANQSDLRDYALLRCVREPLAGRLRDADRSVDEIADILGDKSLGKFLYTIRALDDLENGSIDTDDLAALPPGMDSFYLDAFERRFARAGRDYAQARDLLGVLALAKEPLPAATLAEILDQPASALQAVRKLLPDFIRLRGDLWAFDHFSLAEWLTGSDDDGFARAGDHAINAEESKARFQTWTLRKIGDGSVQDSAYLVRHLAAHLIDDDERQRVFAKLMLTNYEWIAQRLRLRGVEALIADCKHLGDLAEAPLLRALFRSSAHVLRRYPDQLPAQLLGRIRSLADTTCQLADLLAATKSWVAQRPAKTHCSMLLPSTGSLRISTSQLARFEEHTEEITTLVPLADGRIAFGSNDGTVRLWDPEGGHKTLIFEGGSRIKFLVLLARGRLAFRPEFDLVHIWDPNDARGPYLPNGQRDWMTALVAMPDGWLASGSISGKVYLWHPGDMHRPRALVGHTDWITILVPLPDGRLASGSENGNVHVWAPNGMCEPRALVGHAGRITILVALPDGRLTSGSENGNVHILDPDGMCEPRVLEGHTGRISALAALPDGRLAWSVDGTVRIWDPEGVRDPWILEGHADRISTLVALPNGRLASGSHDGTVRIWDPDGVRDPWVLEGHTDRISTLLALPNGRLASGSHDGTVRLWNPKGADTPRDAEGRAGEVTDIVDLLYGRLATRSEDGSVRIWDLNGTREPCNLAGQTEWFAEVVAMPDGRLATRSEDGSVRIWDLNGTREPCNLAGQTERFAEVVAMPDGRLATRSEDGTVCIWDPEGVRKPRVLEGRIGWDTTLVVLADGRLALDVRVLSRLGVDLPVETEGRSQTTCPRR
ncbi:MAG: DUF4062 domain-containing protein [Sterolibacteriaceae bacterium]|nr:DUF4062 domain-containing protein [Candidatus Methylophosphatis haderslevensis]